MKIESVAAIPFEMPLQKVFSGSFYRVTSRNTIVTRIRTVGGHKSEVYNGDNRAMAARLRESSKVSWAAVDRRGCWAGATTSRLNIGSLRRAC
jgi:hypothetical protein